MLTHGNISRLLIFLSGLYRGQTASLYETQILARSTPGERAWIERMCECSRFTRLGNNADYELSEKGRIIAKDYVDGGDVQHAFRSILKVYVEEMRPAWAFKIPAGREEAFAAMSADEIKCFEEAGLGRGSLGEDVIRWWDQIAALFRNPRENEMLEIGREGERLTIKYEINRIGFNPTWVSIESNYAGYDILSRESEGSSSRRLIEVKATRNNVYDAEFYISRNEWDTAEASQSRYYFYIWVCGAANKLAIVSTDEMRPHVAVNKGAGRWVSISVPYSEFDGKFVIV